MGLPENGKLTGACSDLARARPGRSADAEDVAQDAFLRAMQLPQPDAVRDPVRYLLRIMRNLIVDRKRSKRRETAAIQSLAVVDLGARMPDPERVLTGKQELKLALDAIKRLPPRCREAFVLHRFKALSYSAIAKRMGISVSMVEKHIAEAMLRVTRATQDSGDLP
jgi:RNA polymerase sigma factor (sigma-70 family)